MLHKISHHHCYTLKVWMVVLSVDVEEECQSRSMNVHSLDIQS